MVALFWTTFAVTLVALAVVVHTGRRGRRRAHFLAVPVFLVLLTATILLTERLARAVDFPPAQMAIHLVCAKSATLLLLPALVTGLLMARIGGRRLRRAHRAAVVVFLTAVVVATGTGIWVFALAVGG